MRSVLSLHWLAAVAATVVAAVVAGGGLDAPATRARGLAPPSLDVAVARTMAAGSARVTGTATMADGTAAVVDGITSFTTGASAFTVRGTLDGATSEVEVRSTPVGTWLRMAPDPRWLPVGDDALTDATGGAGWADLLGQLRGATDVVAAGSGTARERRLRGTLGGQRLDVELDRAGRIVRVRVAGGGTLLDLRLRDFATPVTVAGPGGATPAGPTPPP